MKRSQFLLLLAALLSGSAYAQTASTYPDRPIRLIVPYPPGGGADSSARLIGQKLSDRLHQAVVVDNRPGGNTLIGASEFARSKPDGYTLFIADGATMSMNPYLYTTLPYDVNKDFEPIIKIAEAPVVLVTTPNGPKTLKELIDLARANPGKVSVGYGSTVTQLGTQLFKDTFNIQLLEVPYKGGPSVGQGLLSNDVTFTLDSVTANLPFIQSGRMVALANAGNAKIASLPNLQKVSDMPGASDFSANSWQGFYTVKGTPQAVINLLNTEIARIVAMDDVKEKIAGFGMIPDVSKSPNDFKAFLEADDKRWKNVIAKSNIPKIN